MFSYQYTENEWYGTKIIVHSFNFILISMIGMAKCGATGNTTKTKTAVPKTPPALGNTIEHSSIDVCRTVGNLLLYLCEF